MDVAGEERIAAPRNAVWAALNDPEVLRPCIPGCQTLEWTSPRELDAGIRFKLGPLSVTFSGKITLSDLKPPESYTIAGEGKGGIAGFAHGACDVTLEDLGEETVLRYQVHAHLGGRLAKLGSQLLDSTANRLAKRFFTELGQAAIAKAKGGV